MLLRSRRSVVIMLLLLMAWPSRTSWSAWKFPQRSSPHRPDPRESATSRAEPVFLLVPSRPMALWDCHRTLWFVLFCVGIVLVYGALLARRHLRPFAALIQLAVFSLSDGWLLAGNSGRRWASKIIRGVVGGSGKGAGGWESHGEC